MVGGGWRVSSSLARRVWHRADDGVLYVPPHVSDVPWAASHEPRSGTSHPRVAKVDDSPSGYSGLLLFVCGIPGMATQPGWIESLRKIRGAGIRQRSQSTAVRRRVSTAGGGRKARRAYQRRGIFSDDRAPG